MSKSTYAQVLSVAQIDSAAYGASTTPTSILPGAMPFTLPANLIDSIGTTFRLTAGGRISNIVTSPGTLTLDIRFGAVIVFNGGAMALNVVAKTNVSWYLEAIFTCRTIGNTTVANMLGMAKFSSESVVGTPLPAAGGNGVFVLPAATPAVGSGFDSTAAQQVNLFGTWSVNNAGNTIQTHLAILELLN